MGGLDSRVRPCRPVWWGAALLGAIVVVSAGCQTGPNGSTGTFSSPARIVSAFVTEGYACDGPSKAGSQWVTHCQQTSTDPRGELSASGPDAHSVNLLTSDYVGVYSSPTTAQVGQAFDAVVHASCQGGGAGKVQSWVDAHLASANADAMTAGFHVHLTQNGVGYYLTISSR